MDVGVTVLVVVVAVGAAIVWMCWAMPFLEAVGRKLGERVAAAEAAIADEKVTIADAREAAEAARGLLQKAVEREEFLRLELSGLSAENGRLRDAQKEAAAREDALAEELADVRRQLATSQEKANVAETMAESLRNDLRGIRAMTEGV